MGASVIPTSSSATSGEGVIVQPSQKPTLAAFVYLLGTMAAIGGFLFGYDTGVVSSAMLYVENNADMQPLSNVWKELVVAVTPGFAGIGSLLAGPTADRFGRRPLIITSSAIFTLGALLCAGAINKWLLLAGRLLLGVAIGFASMTVPVYLSESSPAHVRGALLACFNALICFGQLAANVFAGIFAFWDPDNVGWRLMFGFAALPAVIQFVAFFFLPESPRWLLEHKGEDESREVLQKVYNGNEAWIKYELAEILATTAQEKAVKGEKTALARVFTTPHVRKALFIGCSLQLFQQLGGINTIMYYTGAIIKGAGVRDNHTTIWLSVVTSGVNFLGTLIPLFLVERLGRKKILIASTIGVVLVLSAMGGAFLLVNRDTANTLSVSVDPTFPNSAVCAGHSNCDFCVTDDRCGFCSPKGAGKAPGFCLPSSSSASEKFSAIGFCSATSPNVTQFEWADVYCHTKWTALPIAIMVVYLLTFAFGMSPIPWVLNAEFYPLWARSTCVALATATNWFANLVISLTFLTLTEAITKFGTFFFYALCTAVGAVVFIVFVPETKGKSLDEIEGLFMPPAQRNAFLRARGIGMESDTDPTSTKSQNSS